MLREFKGLIMINRKDNQTFQDEERPSRCSETVMFSRFLRTVQRPRKVFLFFGTKLNRKLIKQDEWKELDPAIDREKFLPLILFNKFPI